jgi:hypothetical protein
MLSPSWHVDGAYNLPTTALNSPAHTLSTGVATAMLDWSSQHADGDDPEAS